MGNQCGEATLFYLAFLFVLNLWSIGFMEEVYPLGCKVDSPDVKCEVYRKNK